VTEIEYWDKYGVGAARVMGALGCAVTVERPGYRAASALHLPTTAPQVEMAFSSASNRLLIAERASVEPKIVTMEIIAFTCLVSVPSSVSAASSSFVATARPYAESARERLICANPDEAREQCGR
jgi:hypothetical protein